MKTDNLFLTLTASALLSVIPAFSQSTSQLEKDLDLLDATIEMAEEYSRNKESLISTLETLLSYPNTSLEQKYTIYGQLFQENYAYSFDRSLNALNNQESIARQLGRTKIQQVMLDKAHLFATAGLYLEARELLETKIDTLSLDKDQRLQYYYTMQRFWKDYKEYSDGKNINGEPVPERYSYFRKRFLEETTEEDFRHRQLVVLDLLESGRLEEADAYNTKLLSDLDSLSHEYAIMSYFQSVICENSGDKEGKLHWLVKSSITDFRNAVKDYASLSSIATELLDTDVERSSRYIQISIVDALFYNAKLRPWQLARLLPSIDAAYSKKQEAQREVMVKRMNALIAIVIVLFILLCILVGNLVHVHTSIRELSGDVESLKEANKTLELRNAEITEAFNRLDVRNDKKREQVVALLGMCNYYLDKLKKNLTPEQRDEELKQYYITFDTAFVQMYPTFVEEFNALLRPDRRIELRPDDILNTELRIFALIRLGITQSSSIASILRYSVNTIYNYRAQIKNSALDERADFEKNVRKIGNIEI